MADSASASLPFIKILSAIWFPPSFLSYFSTCIAQSGHILAHIAQAMHCSGSLTTTGKYPLAFICLPMTSIFFGQAVVQRAHPLQRSSKIVTLLAIVPPPTLFVLYTFPRGEHLPIH